MLQLELTSRMLTLPPDLSVRLRQRDCQLLTLLAHGQPCVPLERLVRNLWDGEIDTNISDPHMHLRVHMHGLRGRLAKAGFPKLVRTVWGGGYALWQPITVLPMAEPTILIPPELVAPLRELMRSHPDYKAAQAFYALVGW